MLGSLCPTCVPDTPPQDSIGALLRLGCRIESRECAIEMQGTMELQFCFSVFLRLRSWIVRLLAVFTSCFLLLYFDLYQAGDSPVADGLLQPQQRVNGGRDVLTLALFTDNPRSRRSFMR